MNANRAELTLLGIRPDTGAAEFQLQIHDRELIGTQVSLTVSVTAEVDYKNEGINHTEEIYQKDFRVHAGRLTYTFSVKSSRVPCFFYMGPHITLMCKGTLKPAGRMGTKKAIVMQVELDKLERKSPVRNAKDIIEPHDDFRLFRNISALAPSDRVQAYGLLVAATAIIIVNTIIGIHDETVPNHMAWLYEDYGRKNGPMEKSLAGSVATGGAVAVRLFQVLKRYMRFSLKPYRKRFRFGMQVPVRKLVDGNSRVELKNAELRIVAGNMENGKYWKKSRNSKSKKDFSEPVRAVTLYRKRIPKIEPGVPLSRYIANDTVCFDEAFLTLYPPISLNADYGVSIQWEIQLIHPDVVDQELIGPSKQFETGDFYVNSAELRLDSREAA